MDLVIGGNGRKLGSFSAYNYNGRDYELTNYISENNNLFWLKSNILSNSFLVMKDCQEGMTLQEMLDDAEQYSVDEIKDYIETLALTHFPIKEIMVRLKLQQEMEFRRGQESIKRDLRELIGV